MCVILNIFISKSIITKCLRTPLDKLGIIQFEIYGDNDGINEASEDRIDDDEKKLDYMYILNDRKSDNAENFHLTNPLKLVQNLPCLKACKECSR